MITPILEKWLIAGKAKIRTHTHWLSAVSKIDVPTNKFIVITDITISPCVNFSNNEDTNSAVIADKNALLQVDLFSGNDERKTFYARSDYEYLTKDEIAYIKNSPPVHFNTLLVYDKNVYVACLKPGGINNHNGFTFGFLSNTQLPEPAISYGNNEQVLKTVNMICGMNYAPAGVNESGAVGGQISNQPIALIDDNSIFGNPETNLYNYNYPLILLQYVIVNEQMRNELE